MDIEFSQNNESHTTLPKNAHKRRLLGMWRTVCQQNPNTVSAAATCVTSTKKKGTCPSCDLEYLPFLQSHPTIGSYLACNPQQFQDLLSCNIVQPSISLLGTVHLVSFV